MAMRETSGRAASEAEQGEHDECVGCSEGEFDAGDEPDLGVGGFDSSACESVLDGGEDGVAVVTMDR